MSGRLQIFRLQRVHSASSSAAATSIVNVEIVLLRDPDAAFVFSIVRGTGD